MRDLKSKALETNHRLARRLVIGGAILSGLVVFFLPAVAGTALAGSLWAEYPIAKLTLAFLGLSLGAALTARLVPFLGFQATRKLQRKDQEQLQPRLDEDWYVQVSFKNAPHWLGDRGYLHFSESGLGFRGYELSFRLPWQFVEDVHPENCGGGIKVCLTWKHPDGSLNGLELHVPTGVDLARDVISLLDEIREFREKANSDGVPDSNQLPPKTIAKLNDFDEVALITKTAAACIAVFLILVLLEVGAGISNESSLLTCVAAPLIYLGLRRKAVAGNTKKGTLQCERPLSNK